ncbi:hypothetical protein [Bdellovibrio sp. HCB337]|uniref:hypothetical protein n=1 Tax=Bdellovibrio sp. HCB337 TaxID=3394358 RepID=UPI0039A60A28
MIRILYSLVALLFATAPHAQASDGGGGYDHGNGGDMCEYRFKTVQDDLTAWIAKGGSAYLQLPPEISHEKYNIYMLDKIQAAKVSCIDEKVFVGNAEKTCKNFVEANGTSRILCNRDRFMTTPESDQYVLVHHEYAGLAGFEVNTGETSHYEISNQISGYLESQIVKKLVVKPPAGKVENPFDSKSCLGPQMTMQNVTNLIPAGKDHIALSTLNIYTRERTCDVFKGCSEWKFIKNKITYPDELRFIKSVMAPNTGTIRFARAPQGISIKLSTNAPGSSDKGVVLSFDMVGEPVDEVGGRFTMMTLPDYRQIGDAVGTVTNNCARLNYKGKEYIGAAGTVWWERETVFLSRY